LWVGLAAAPASRAASEDPEALIRQGVQLRKAGENAKALGYFQRAYDIAHTPRTAAQLGLVSLALGKWMDAELRLGEALSAADPWVESHLKALEQGRASAREHLGKVEIEGAPPAAAVDASGRPTSILPSDGVIWVVPGTIRLRVEAPGFKPVSQETSVAAGASTRVHLAMEPREPEATAARESGGAAAGAGADTGAANQRSGAGRADLQTRAGPSDAALEDQRARHRRYRIASVVTAAAGVAAGVTGFIFRGIASQKLDAIRSDAAAGNDRPYDPSNGNYGTFDKVGLGLMIAGGATVGASVITYLINRDAAPERARPALSLQAGPGQLGLLIAGGF
jgi:hypothetical protein